MSRLLAVRAILIVAQVTATIWIALSYQRNDNNPVLLLGVSALPLAQASLLAVWGVWSRWPAYVRVPAVIVGVTTLWVVQCRVLNIELSDARGAAYAMMFAVQTLLVSGMVATTRLTGQLFFRRRTLGEPKRRAQFSIRVVLGWIAAIALILGTWRLALGYTEWTAEVVKNRFFLFGAAIGTYNAVYALIVVAGVCWGRRWYRPLTQAVLALGLVGVIAYSQSALLRNLFQTDGYVGTAGWMVQAGFQWLYVLITLVPIRLWRYNNEQAPAKAER